MEKILTMHQAIEYLRNSPFVKEKYLGDHISSFNFTRDAFKHNEWNDETIKARGLFIDTRYEVVKARSYDKFFHVGERHETELPEIDKWREGYYVDAYVKENGYLGICSWEQGRELFCASKSTNKGWFAERFREILLDTLGDKDQDFSEYLRREGLSAVFEVIDPENDSHIIEYDKPQVILLDLIYNEWEPGDLEFVNKSYEILQMCGARFGLKVKEHAARLWSYDEIVDFYNKVTAPGYKYNGHYIEGFVIEGANGQHAKIKTEYYNYWKSWRPVIAAVRKGNEVRYDKIDFENHQESSYILWLVDTFANHYYAIHEEDLPIINLQKLYRVYNDYVLK